VPNHEGSTAVPQPVKQMLLCLTQMLLCLKHDHWLMPMIVQAKGSPAGRLLGVMPGVLQAALLECSLQEGCATYCRRCACFNCSRADRMKGCGMQVHVPESTHAFPAYTRLHTCTGNCRLRQSAQGMGWHLSGAMVTGSLALRNLTEGPGSRV